MAKLSQAADVVIRIFLEATVYGMSLILFGATLWVLCHNRPIKNINHAMLAVTCLLFLLSTTHVALSLTNILNWFAHGANYDFHTTTQVSSAQDLIYASQTLLADAVVIYRCYVVWQSRLVVLFPILLWLTVLVATIRIETAIRHNNSAYLFTKQGAAWLALYYSMTFATNVISTGLLAYRIWRINRETTRARMRVMKHRLLPVMNICLDSGLLYTATLVIAIVLFGLHSPETFTVQDPLPHVIAITFYMVIIRIGIAAATPTTVYSATEPSSDSTDKTSTSRTIATYTPQLTTAGIQRSTLMTIPSDSEETSNSSSQ